MDRKVLTYQENGVTKDFIPYVDDLGVIIGGTNLRDYLSQIENQIEKSNLFLGAFESENSLLQKHPNGSELAVGTYAIVSDEDALYIYDTDTSRWLKTAGATIGIVQLNGLNAINGALTITGGDIDSTVSTADTPTMKISAHLNELYTKCKEIPLRSYGSVAYDSGIEEGVVENNYIVYRAQVSTLYKNSRLLVIQLRDNLLSSEYNNLKMKIIVNYSDGTIRQSELRTADGQTITHAELNSKVPLEKRPYVMLSYDEYRDSVFRILNVYSNSTNLTVTRNIYTNTWIDNEEGTGYKATFDFSEYFNVNLLNVYKKVDNSKTTAVYDYKITNNILTLYSEEKFEGGIVVSTYL